MEPRLSLLPSAPERAFALSWANLVDFIAAMRFDVDFNHSNYLQGFIVPPRLLTAADTAPFIPDFTSAQNRALVLGSLFADANAFTKGGMLNMWQKNMLHSPGTC